MKYLHFPFLIVLLLVISCKKDEIPDKNTCGTPMTSTITSADLLNCKYKPGSYWIIIDSATMFIDSLRVTEFTQNPLYDMCENVYENHAFMVRSNLGGFKRYIVVAGGLFMGFTGYANSGELIYDDYESTLMQNQTRLDSLFVYDRYYYKVVRVEIENDHTEGYDRSIYYTNSDYGFLKHEVYNDNNALISRKLLMHKNIVR
ncbi:MAG: hypothetical protein ACO1N0_14555 [Fluviicola sp.]